jgi:hypothetical protein
MAKTTSAERMRRMRERAQGAAWGSDDDLAAIPLSGLLELLSSEVRRCHRDSSRGQAICAGYLKAIGERVGIEVHAVYDRRD